MTNVVRFAKFFRSAIRPLIVGAALVLIGAMAATSSASQAGAGNETAKSLADDAGTPAATAKNDSLETGVVSIGWGRVTSLLKRGDPSMWGLVVCSVLTLTFVLERLIVVRSSRVMPRSFVERFLDRLQEGELDRGKARELCRDNGSPIANLFGVIINNSGSPASEIRQAVSEAAQSELFQLKRRVRALNAIATLAPLLGLFGTVIGMIEAFAALSKQSGAAGKTELLAGGISLALIATATGLCVAIIAAAAYYFLLGRVDRVVQEMDDLANEVIGLVSGGGRAVAADKSATPRPRVVPAREQASV